MSVANALKNSCSLSDQRLWLRGDQEGGSLGVAMPTRTRPILELTEPDKKRFWEKVNKDATSGCWEWTACPRKNREGYGAFWFNGRHCMAHRISYELCRGPIPNGLQINHHCHNTKCVRPDHLYAGTHAENMQDMTDAGRKTMPKGEDSTSAKLTEKQVFEIRDKYIPWKYTMQRLADEYSVGLVTVFDIIRGKTWVETL